MHALPDEHELAPGQVFVVARNGALRAVGREPDAEIEESDAAIPSGMAAGGKRRAGAQRRRRRSRLLDPRCGWRMRWRIGKEYAALGLAGNLRAAGRACSACPVSATLDRRCPAALLASAPFDLLPAPNRRTSRTGRRADRAVGTLGGSNFSPEALRRRITWPRRRPPWSGLRRSRRSGDGSRRRCDRPPREPIINVPAWRWGNSDGAGLGLQDERRSAYHMGRIWAASWLRAAIRRKRWRNRRVGGACARRGG